MFDGLNSLELHGDPQILLLFAIIEMLITYEAKGTGDASITNQIRRKMPVLLNRFEEPVPLPKAFGEITQENVWKALYDLRSKLAHGSLADFDKGNHAALKNQKLASGYLREAVKALIRHAICDPQLLRDLKDV